VLRTVCHQGLLSAPLFFAFRLRVTLVPFPSRCAVPSNLSNKITFTISGRSCTADGAWRDAHHLSSLPRAFLFFATNLRPYLCGLSGKLSTGRLRPLQLGRLLQNRPFLFDYGQFREPVSIQSLDVNFYRCVRWIH
jgi:hypothetical protein